MNLALEVDTVAAAAWRTIVLAAISVTLIGCKDVGRDMAACKVKAIEVYKPNLLEADERAREYVLNCMQAMGYRLVSLCASSTAGYTYLTCYE